MIYFDTSYIAKCYLNEPGSEAVRQLAGRQDRIACCALGQVELTAAFHRKLREGEIDSATLDILLRQLELDDSQGLWTWLAVTADLLEKSAAAFKTLAADVYLRSADAIHLTCCAGYGLPTIYSNDKHLLAAAERFGVAGENILV